MNEQTTTTHTELSFKDFLVKNRHHRTILYLAAGAIVIQYFIFKNLYPFANYIHGDSFSYLKAADQNLNINTYPIGYSKFLRLFSVFNRTDYALTAFQYLFIQCSTLYFLFTIFYFYKPCKIIKTILLSFMVLNPLFLHLSNLISSDCLFTGLSILWFSLLLWIIHRPSTIIIKWHAIALFAAFTVRYNAMIYPLLAVIAFGLSKMPLRQKLAGLSMVILLCGSFISFTMYKYKKLTGYWQYSPFMGWQLANNAMFAYRFVDSPFLKPVPHKYQAIDKKIHEHYYLSRNDPFYSSEKALASTFYMWTPNLPLMQYSDSVFKEAKDTTASKFSKWAYMGPFYKSYGLHLIKSYPSYFAAYFVWPNTLKYYAPPLEFLETYNSGRDTVTYLTKTWFEYKSQKVTTRMKNRTIWVLNFYPILSGITNLVMVFGLLYYVLLKGWHYNQVFNKTVIIGSFVWLSNAIFTVFASSAALRFQSFPILITTVMALLLVDWIFQLMNMKIKESKENIQDDFLPKVVA
jgi:hypothetical protein